MAGAAREQEEQVVLLHVVTREVRDCRDALKFHLRLEDGHVVRKVHRVAEEFAPVAVGIGRIAACEGNEVEEQPYGVLDLDCGDGRAAAVRLDVAELLGLQYGRAPAREQRGCGDKGCQAFGHFEPPSGIFLSNVRISSVSAFLSSMPALRASIGGRDLRVSEQEYCSSR